MPRRATPLNRLLANCGKWNGFSGKDKRYQTEYAQNYPMINNQDLFYILRVSTSDGKYVITACRPVSNPILSNNGNTHPGGETFQQFMDAFNSYITNTKAELDA